MKSTPTWKWWANLRTAVPPSSACRLNPGVVVMDITMPDMNGMAATRQILRERPQAKVLILSMHADRRFIAETLGAGAAGCLLKDGAFEELVLAIRTLVAGKTYL